MEGLNKEIKAMNWKTLFGAAILISAVLLGAALLQPAQVHRQRTALPDEGRGWLGARLDDVTPEKARELKLPGEYGAIVREVEEGSPGAKAGLAQDDVILVFDGERVRSVAQLRRLARETPPGRSVTLEISRKGEKIRLQAKLEAAPGPSMDFHFEMPAIPPIHIPHFGPGLLTGRALLGISGDDLTPQLAAYFGVKEGKGVLVREVEPDSAASRAGLKAGDCIVRADSKDVASVEDLRQALEKVESRKVALVVVRDRRELTVTAELEPAERWNPDQVAELRGLGVYGPNPEELKQIFDQARQAQEQAREAVRQAQKEFERSKEEWQRQLQNMQRQLQEQLRQKRETAAGTV